MSSDFGGSRDDPVDSILNGIEATGALSTEDFARLQTLLAAHPERVTEVNERLRRLGAEEVGSGPVLVIADYYREGDTPYHLRWPLSAHLGLPIPFEQLDRETQFFVLFTEWTRREAEGMVTLSEGAIDQAETVFQECLERAGQLDVSELQARSYEALVRVAERRGDPAAQRRWLEAARTARS